MSFEPKSGEWLSIPNQFMDIRHGSPLSMRRGVCLSETGRMY